MATVDFKDGKYRVRWIDEHGERKPKAFANKAEANSFSILIEAEVEKARLGLVTSSSPGQRKMASVFDHWLQYRATLKRSAKDDVSVIKTHLRPPLGHLLLKDAASTWGSIIRQRMVGRSEKTIHNVLTLLNSVLNEAEDMGWIGKAPKIKKPSLKLHRQKFKYLQNEDEVRRFLIAAQAEGEMVFTLYCTLIYTGLRAGEVAGLRRSDISLAKENPIITVVRSYNGPTKDGEIRYVPIMKPLIPVLTRWMLQNPTEILFPNRDGKTLSPSARQFQEILKRVLDRAGLFTDVDGKRKYNITLHSLRHSFASHFMMNYGQIDILQRILGHSTPAMTMRYSHMTPEAFKREADRIPDFVPNEDGNVINFKLR